MRQSPIDVFVEYIPYYILELEDGSKILAQVSQNTAKALEKGESDAIPIGRKHGFSQGAKNMLSDICEENQVSTEYVWYAIDNEWQKKNSFGILIGKAAVAVVFFFVLAVILELVVDKLLGKRKES